MSGVVFVVTVPSENHEKSLKKSITTLINKEKPLPSNNQSVISKYVVKAQEKSASLNRKLNKESKLLNNWKHTLMRSKSLEKLPKCLNECRRESSVSFKDDEVITQFPMEKELKNILEKLNIDNASWTLCENDTYWQVVFPSKSGWQCEEILEALKDNKIGRRCRSIVSVIPCNLYYHSDSETNRNSEEYNISNVDLKQQAKEKDTGWSRFLTSIRARLTVAQLVESIKSDALLTFDFVCLLIIATVLCAIGLVENSNVYLLSSMLISPMMGPVMAATFGTVIRDSQLQKIGVNNALIGLGLATFVGFCYGTVICLFCNKYGENDWPTFEMTSRGEIRTLWVGCLIALLSGAAVALGILGDNVASLVGVAISTSLMPPAVNAGLLWSLASLYSIKGNDSISLSLPHHHYSQDTAIELAALGGMSICLTFVNIVCIYLAGILVFKIKEVAPMTSKDQAKRRFWKHDIKIARDYNRTFQNDDAKALYDQLQKELNYQVMSDHVQDSGYNRNNRHHSTDYLREKPNGSWGFSQYTWSPCTNDQQFNRPTVQELHHLYKHLLEKKYGFVGSRKPSRAWSNQQQMFEEENYPVSEQDLVIDIPEVNNGSESPLLPVNSSDNSANGYFSRPKRFTVTPSSSDPLKENT
ncbi:uncharacterized protein LOC108744740 [Agrilus planipennis]|uniref:Uncharacterized protein LOC108744740 n=1 Tax=Agrilus planipennis TaxID=224129 RepID=A0A1W4XUS7_AGRPL|nr:uncharacterized protein LOC108744740 [Agrilus planipennis]